MKIVWHSCHLYWCDPVLFSLRNWRRIQSIRYKNIPGRKWPAQRTEKALYKNILIINSQSIGKLMMWMLHKTFKLSCSSSPLILLPWSFSVMGRQQLKITSYKNSIKSQLQKKNLSVKAMYDECGRSSWTTWRWPSSSVGLAWSEVTLQTLLGWLTGGIWKAHLSLKQNFW